MSPINIIMAPCLQSDGWISVSACNSNVIERLKAHSNINLRICNPLLGSINNKWIRALVRHIFYPLTVKRTISNSPPDSILHVTDQYYAPLIRFKPLRSVVTCHDLILFRFSDISPRQRERWFRRVAYAKKANAVMAVSECTAKDLQLFGGVPSDKIIVNHNGRDPFFRILTDGHNYGPAASAVRKMRTDRILLLSLGHNVIQKNLARLLSSVDRLRAVGLPVTVIKAGAALDKDYQRIAIGKEPDQDLIINLGYVSKQDVLELYNSCHMLVFPSLYEGFGLPVIEAQACGLPCITSKISSLPEVGGNAALYCDPESADDIADKISILAKDQSLQAELRNKGMTNIMRFSWDRHVESLVNVYSKLATK